MTIKQEKKASVLVVLTNVNDMKNHESDCRYTSIPRSGCPNCPTTQPQERTQEGNLHRTGFDIFEVGHVWEAIHNKMNARVVFATPSGGEAPIAPMTIKEAEKDESIRHFIRDRSYLDTFKNTQPLDKINPDEFSCIIIPGAHGAMIDLAKNERLADIITSIYENQGGHVATIGHGAAALLNVKSRKENRDYLIKNMQLTASTDEEEHEKGFDKVIPYSLEEKLKERGARFEKTRPFGSHVVLHDRLLTAQNYFSVNEWIKKMSNMKGF